MSCLDSRMPRQAVPAEAGYRDTALLSETVSADTPTGDAQRFLQGAGVSAATTGVSSESSGTICNASVAVGYTLDLSGGARRGIEARALRLADTAALFAALGGGRGDGSDSHELRDDLPQGPMTDIHVYTFSCRIRSQSDPASMNHEECA